MTTCYNHIDTIEFLARLKSAAFPGVAPEALPEKFEVAPISYELTQLSGPFKHLIHFNSLFSDPISIQLPASIVGPNTYTQIQEEIERDHLLPSHTFSTAWLNKCQEHFDRDPEFNTLLAMEPAPEMSTLALEPQDIRGTQKRGYYEKCFLATDVTGNLASASVMTAKNSTSFSRAPAKRSDFVRGKAGYFPFTPGGLDPEEIKGVDVLEAEKEALGMEDIDVARSVIEGLSLGEDLLTVPPGFARGLFSEKASSAEQGETRDAVFSMNDIFAGQQADDEDGLDSLLDPVAQPTQPTQPSQPSPASKEESKVIESTDDAPADVDAILEGMGPIVTAPKRAVASVQPRAREWAQVVDVNEPFTNFHELVPELAHDFPFELDTFQKRAVYHLEKGECVFVAAHTSAGKTVVAEYAIALAAKHMTKAIYTSPIKALSNQKFRDFKGTFEEVGILTGDVQINPEASCLIMTTEILRSMLYRGADLIRDVEFVIFDEVHYVNDLERGVVWEEVIIMLPAHVTLILLSATVPNTKEFADWVG